MHLSIRHVTRYTFAESAAYSIQSLRLTPQSFDGQRVLSWSITAKPPGSEMIETFDGFGNVLHLLPVDGPHETLEITAEGVVDLENRNGVVSGLQDLVPPRVYLKETPLTAPPPALKALAAGIRADNAIGKLHSLMAAIREEIDYLPGATNAATTAAEALAAKKGVCQDHAHVFIAASRTLNIPARYVTGYLLTDGETTESAHHAWAEAFVEGLGWVGFDVANNLCPTDSYVRLATGLDAHYAAPVRGSRRGGVSEELLVEVTVRQMVVQAQSQSSGQAQAQSQSQGQTQSPSQAKAPGTAKPRTRRR